jgi:hypothetical protein
MDNELEQLFDSRLKFDLLLKTINNPDLLTYLKDNDIPEKFGLMLLVQMNLLEIANIETLVGILQSKCDNVQHCANLLEKCIEIDLVDYNGKWFLVRHKLERNLLQKVKALIYPLPMTSKPNILKTNNDSAYSYIGSESVITKPKLNYHTNEVCLSHINKMNNIALSINNIDKTKNYVKPKKDDTAVTLNQKKQRLNKFMSETNDIYTHLIMQGNKFHLAHKYDKRGRIYPCGYHITYSGNEYQKSVIELFNKKVINDE